MKCFKAIDKFDLPGGATEFFLEPGKHDVPLDTTVILDYRGHLLKCYVTYEHYVHQSCGADPIVAVIVSSVRPVDFDD
jgi:hypothetical protein